MGKLFNSRHLAYYHKMDSELPNYNRTNIEKVRKYRISQELFSSLLERINKDHLTTA
jgi:hypothetical protein